MTCLVYVLGGLALGVSVTGFGRRLLAAWLVSAGAVALLPVLWAVVFVTGAALMLDTSTVGGPGFAGFVAQLYNVAAALAVFAVAIKLARALLGQAGGAIHRLAHAPPRRAGGRCAARAAPRPSAGRSTRRRPGWRASRKPCAPARARRGAGWRSRSRTRSRPPARRGALGAGHAGGRGRAAQRARRPAGPRQSPTSRAPARPAGAQAAVPARGARRALPPPRNGVRQAEAGGRPGEQALGRDRALPAGDARGQRARQRRPGLAPRAGGGEGLVDAAPGRSPGLARCRCRGCAWRARARGGWTGRG